MTPYSLDLRERVLAAVDQGGQSVAAVARTFCVSSRWVFKLLRQRRHEGSCAPRPHAGGRTPSVAGADLERLRDHLRDHPDAFLVELRQTLNLDVSLPSVWRAIQRLGVSRKKNRPVPGSNAAPRCRPNDRPGPGG